MIPGDRNVCWSDFWFEGAKITTNATTSVSASTETTVALAAEVHDEGDYYDAGTPSRLTVPTGRGGYFLVQASCGLEALGTNKRWLFYVRKNGTTVVGPTYDDTPNGAGNPVAACTSNVVLLAAGDYIELRVNQLDSVSRNVPNDSGRIFLALTRLGL